jgi:hypothetical protein
MPTQLANNLCSHMRQNCMWHWRDFWPEIMTLVWSLNIVGSDKVFILGGRPFIYITKCKGTKIVPWIASVMLSQKRWIADWYHICPQSVFWCLVLLLISLNNFFLWSNQSIHLKKNIICYTFVLCTLDEFYEMVTDCLWLPFRTLVYILIEVKVFSDVGKLLSVRDVQ